MLAILSNINYATAQTTCVWPTPTNTTTECGPGSLMLLFSLFLIPFIIGHIVSFYLLVRKFYNDSDGKKA